MLRYHVIAFFALGCASIPHIFMNKIRERRDIAQSGFDKEYVMQDGVVFGTAEKTNYIKREALIKEPKCPDGLLAQVK